jgi:hypothetical protein
VYHYNGQQWSNVYTYNGAGTTLLGLDHIWGDAPNNIYAVGSIDSIPSGNYKGAIMHFDGSTWSFVSIPDYRVRFNGIRRGLKESNKYYLRGTRIESVGDTNKIYEFDGSILKEIYSGQELLDVNEMVGKIYFSIGKKIFKYKDNQFVIWKDFSGTSHAGRMWGRSEIDFFTVGYTGIMHYNGTDLQLLYPTSMFFDLAVFSSEIFILDYANGYPNVVHGKLQNN